METINQAILAGSGRRVIPGAASGAGADRFSERAGCSAHRRHGGGDCGADRLFRLSDPARHRAGHGAAVHRIGDGRLRLGGEGAGAANHSLRAQERRRHRAGAEGPCRPAAHEARRIRPAEGWRHRLRNLRQVGCARLHQLRAERQSPARARRRAGPHHPLDRPGADRARPSGAAGATAVLARPQRAFRLDRAAGARIARAGAGARHPSSRRLGGERAQTAAHLDRRRSRPPARRRRDGRRNRQQRGQRGRAPGRLREAHARAGRDDRVLGGRPGPRARAAHRRFRP